jgi:CrcB protein
MSLTNFAINAGAVAVGGMLGTALRMAIDSALPHAPSAFPVSTLLLNTLGSLVLGLLVGWLWPRAKPWLRFGLGTGLLGSFTTFSAVVVSLIALGDASQWVLAAVYLATTLLFGLSAAWVGLRVGARVAQR